MTTFLTYHTAIPYREVQGNPCNENREPAMRTGFPCNESRFFPVGIDLQGNPVSYTGFGFAVYNLNFLNSVTCTCHKRIYVSWNSISMFLRTGFLRRVVTLQTIPRNPQHNSITLWSLIETSSKLLKATPLQIDFKHMGQNMLLCVWIPWTCPF